jgi:hypothetical protein
MDFIGIILGRKVGLVEIKADKAIVQHCLSATIQPTLKIGLDGLKNTHF